MFGKNNNTYLFPSPSLHHHHHHHHHPDVFSGHHHHHYKDNIVQALVENHHHQASAAGFLNNNQAEVDQKKPAVTKKDRHSKIFTSQGPRDRRVRLSIGIARKFFDLQEMLGFDKPSKTLDWLLTKSKSSIKDLIVQTTKQKSRNDLDDEEDDDNKNSSSPILPGELGGNDKGRSGNIKNKGSSSSLKESRAKARARARERTREKMCIKQQQQLTNSSEVNYVNSVGANFQQQQLVEESVLIKRKPSSSSSSFLGFQQNVFVSGYDHDHDQNWDVCSFASQANLCTILDQHKFMNSSSNM